MAFQRGLLCTSARAQKETYAGTETKLEGFLLWLNSQVQAHLQRYVFTNEKQTTEAAVHNRQVVDKGITGRPPPEILIIKLKLEARVYKYVEMPTLHGEITTGNSDVTLLVLLYLGNLPTISPHS